MLCLHCSLFITLGHGGNLGYGGNLNIFWLGGKPYSCGRGLLGDTEGIEDSIGVENSIGKTRKERKEENQRRV